jgi:uncharacterized protein (TIGR02246 family)
MNRFPACIILSVAVLGNFAVTAATAQSGPEEAVSGLMAAWNLKDAQAFASQFTEDATFVNVNGALWIGRKDIEDRHTKAAIFKSSHAEIKPDSMRLLRPDIALVHVSWTITGDPRDPQPRSYLMTMVVSKRDGRWLIVAAQNGSAVDRFSLPGTSVLVPSPLPTAPDADHTPSDVRKLLVEADTDWNRNDAKAAASLFVDDADLVDTSARRFSGRDDIEKHIADGHWFSALPHEQKGEFREAIVELEKAVSFSRGGAPYRALLANAYALAGEQAKALSVLDELRTQSEQGLRLSVGLCRRLHRAWRSKLCLRLVGEGLSRTHDAHSGTAATDLRQPTF